MRKIIEQIERVRSLQKEYFRTRDKVVLSESKSAERELDRLLAEQKQNEATPITEEWLAFHGFSKQYEKNHLGELCKYEWESGFQHLILWKNKGRFECGMLGNCPIKTLGDLYVAIDLLKIDFE